MASFSSAPPPPSVTRTSDCTTITPATPHSALVVIMHGLGDTAAGFEDVAMLWARQMPHVKFVLPTAPTQPVTMNMGMPMPSWYDIVGLDERSNENCDGIDASAARITGILAEEHQSTQLPYSRMVLSGFSQGGALSLFAGLQRQDDEQLAGVLCMSGYLAGAKKFALSNSGKATPVLHCHGTVDPMVKFEMAQKTEAEIKKAGHTNYTLKSYPIQHTVTPEEIGDALQFLNGIIPPDPSCDIKPKAVDEMSVKELKAAIRNGGLGQQAAGLCEKQELVKLLKENGNK